MKLVTAAQMRQIDRHAIESVGVPSLSLMEKAGEGVVAILREKFSPELQGAVLVYCGTGNNGGDGLAIARMLHEQGVEVAAVLCGDEAKLTGDALSNLSRARSLGVRVFPFSVIERGEAEHDAPSLIVDALLGTGTSGPPREEIARPIARINESGCPVVAVDVPSGVSSDSGAVETIAVNATHTCTLGLPKLGLYVSPGREHAGIVAVIDIGLPSKSVNASSHIARILNTAEVLDQLPARKPNGHKGDFGKLLIVAGSTGLAGAAALSAKAALRSGCGLVKVALPASVLPTVAALVPEATTYPLPDLGERGVLALRSLGEILRLADEHDAVALGPGIGRHHETRELVRRLVQRVAKPLVIDADGINALAGESELLRERTYPTILTPHPGEYLRLTGEPAHMAYLDRIEQVRRVAAELKVVLLLKGSPVLVASPDGEVWVNPTGNDGMATGGTGDVLTGIIGSILVQGAAPEVSARLGAFIHGLAGDLASTQKTKRAMIASDVIEALPAALYSVESIPERIGRSA